MLKDTPPELQSLLVVLQRHYAPVLNRGTLLAGLMLHKLTIKAAKPDCWSCEQPLSKLQASSAVTLRRDEHLLQATQHSSSSLLFSHVTNAADKTRDSETMCRIQKRKRIAGTSSKTKFDENLRVHGLVLKKSSDALATKYTRSVHADWTRVIHSCLSLLK
jgi:hypothetical protein